MDECALLSKCPSYIVYVFFVSQIDVISTNDKNAKLNLSPFQYIYRIVKAKRSDKLISIVEQCFSISRTSPSMHVYPSAKITVFIVCICQFIFAQRHAVGKKNRM